MMSENNSNIAGKIVVITGASSGLGEATAQHVRMVKTIGNQGTASS
nr:hypothetical protein [Ktedonobacter robiniae]